MKRFFFVFFCCTCFAAALQAQLKAEPLDSLAARYLGPGESLSGRSFQTGDDPNAMIVFLGADKKQVRLHVLSASGNAVMPLLADSITQVGRCFSIPYLDTAWAANLDKDAAQELVVILHFWPVCDSAIPYAMVVVYDSPFTTPGRFSACPPFVIYELPFKPVVVRQKVVAELRQKGLLKD